GNDVTVLLGGSVLPFNFPTHFPVGHAPVQVAAGALDGDSNVDVAATCSETSELVILHGNGAGALGSPFFIPAGYWPTGICIADVDANGRPDVLVANPSQQATFTAYLTSSAGDLFLPGSLQGGVTTNGVAAADLNGDGLPDLASTHYDPPSTVRVWLQQPSVGFVTSQSLAVGPHPYAIVAVDLDLDGVLDLAAANEGTNSVAVLHGAGGGAFASPVSFAAGSAPRGLAVADLDADGLPDLVAANWVPSGLSVLFDAPGGILQPPVTQPSGGNSALTPRILDFNLDGLADVAVTNVGSKNVVAWKNNGAGGLVFASATVVGTQPTALVAGDWNGDGLADLATACGESNDRVWRLTGNGQGSFTAVEDWLVDSDPTTLLAADVDLDGRTDLVLALEPGSQLAIMRGDASGAFLAPVRFATVRNPNSIAAVDLEGDGRVDLVAGSFTTSATNIAIALHRNVALPPAGMTSFGVGTPGCFGFLGLATKGEATLGDSSFGLRATNAPPHSIGLGLLGDAADLAGSDPFGLGVTLHVDLFATSFLVGLDFSSDAGGTAFAPAPIPNLPGIVGVSFEAQSLWLEAPAAGWSCSTAIVPLVSSRGLTFTVAP
ncbi:MAG TPA: VCBS repeat-containing protein, partial [Planctomycetota bacterium]|nr:VCBS repeat-containing protein [Planctomycetota bacterium]